MDLFVSFALAATTEALDDAQLKITRRTVNRWG